MTSQVLQVVLGAGIGSAFVLGVRRIPFMGELYAYSVGLIVAALVYVAFAAALGGGGSALLLEAGGVGLFTAVAFLGFARVPVLVGLGWLGHVAWDVALHPLSPGSYSPHWYPLLCLGFDLVVGGWAVFAARTGRLVGASTDRRRDDAA